MKPPNQNSKSSGSGDPQAMNKCNFWSPPSTLKTGAKHLAQKAFKNSQTLAMNRGEKFLNRKYEVARSFPLATVSPVPPFVRLN